MTTTAVIVTHNPPGDFRQRVNAVAAEVDRIVIVDNASAPAVRDTLGGIQQTFPGRVECLLNAENRGLAIALNQGITHALQSGAEWVLLLDHDSQPKPGMVATMLRAHDAWHSSTTVGLVAPDIDDENAGLTTRYLMQGGAFGFRRAALNVTETDQAMTVITSGSLIKASTFQKIGMMNEAFFIDYIDHDFCLRMKQKGLDILLVRDAVLRHRLGDKTSHNFAGQTFVASNHNAARRFTIFRNRLWVYREHGRQFPGFVLHDLLASGFDIFRIVACEDHKTSKLKAIGRGILAGLRGPG